MQRTLDTARDGKIEPVDKKDETVRGTLPLFKLRSRADRAKWQKLVLRQTGNFYTESDCKLKPFLCRHFRLERVPPVVLPSPASTRWTLQSCPRSSWTFSHLTRLTGEKLPSDDKVRLINYCRAGFQSLVGVLDPSFTLSSDAYYRGLLSKVLMMRSLLPVLH